MDETLHVMVSDTVDERPRRVDRAGLARGTLVDRYVVLEQIGQGGMGVVYKAYDPDLDRTIAIKLVRADSRNPDQRQRLRARLVREAQALARLSHPNVVTVHDVGSFEDGVFVAMELVEGEPLRDVLEREAPAVERILELFAGAGRGVVAAHAASIVHRDFKPENVIVGKDGVPRVLDFGLARALHEEGTENGMVMGTPGYMSPEQRAGEDLDASTDQFSFCVALHEALFGTKPDAQPATIGSRAASGSRVSARVRAALQRGLARDRAHRHASLQALLDELAVVQRRRMWMAAAAVAGLAIGALVVVMMRSPTTGPTCDGAERRLVGIWDGARRDAVRDAVVRSSGMAVAATVVRELDRYAQTWVVMHESSCRATRISGEQSPELLDLRTACLDGRLAELRELGDLIQADAAAANAALDGVRGLSALDECANIASLRDPLPPRDPAMAKVLRPQLARVRVQLVLGKSSVVQRDSLVLAGAADAAGDRWLRANALYLHARAQRQLGDLAGAEDELYRAIPVAEAARASHVLVDIWMTLAWIVGDDRGRYGDAVRLIGIARGILERIGGDMRLEASLEDHIGVLDLDRGELVDARSHLERGLALRQKLYGKDSEYATSLQHLAILEETTGNLEKALAMYHEARELAEAELGTQHPDVLAMLGAEGAALYQLGRYLDAKALLGKGLPIAEQTAGPDSALVAMFLTNLGLVEQKLSRFTEAKSAFTRARTIAEHLDPESERVARLELNLALLHVDTHELDEARVHAERAVAAYERLAGKDSADAAEARDVLAKATRPTR